MTTLTIDFSFQEPELTLKGLSFKALKGIDIEKCIYKSDTGKYAIGLEYNGQLDPKTCRIKEDFLIKGLKDIRTKIPFDKIKTVGYYQLTADELMKLIFMLPA